MTYVPYEFMDCMQEKFFELSSNYPTLISEDKDRLMLFATLEIIFDRADDKTKAYNTVSDCLKNYYLSGIAV